MKLTIQLTLLIILLVAFIMALRPKWQVKNKKELGVRLASPIYSDQKGTKLLVAKSLDLQGKPDYIFKTWIGRRYIPLEIKSGVLKELEPHSGDMYQLVAYFLIIEEVYGKRPPYGKLVYANKTFKIRNTRKLRRQLLLILKRMRGMLEGDTKVYVEPSFLKCRNCICRSTVCEFSEEE